MVEEIINGEEVKIVIILGKIIEDNGNWFVVYVVLVDFYKQVRWFFVEVMCLDSIVSVSYNIFVFWFMGNDGIMYDGFDDDGEYGVGRLLLKVFIDNDVKNILVVVL